jgi:hypothetical protein
MCSPLELRASSSSSRDVLYSWSCYDSDVINALLQTENGPVLAMRAGTPEMEVDTFFTFAVTATNFLGVRSAPQTLRVLKQRAPSPVLSFLPPAVSALSTDEVTVSAALKFSSCRGAEGDMVFAWSQFDGPLIPDRFLSGTSSQLFIPSNVLLGGRSYVFALRVFNSGDPSQSVESTVHVRIKNSALRAIIAGGGSREVSTIKEVSTKPQVSWVAMQGCALGFVDVPLCMSMPHARRCAADAQMLVAARS